MAPRDGVFTIKAQLKGITKPPVWRRIRIVGGASFGQLHEALQAASNGKAIIYTFSNRNGSASVVRPSKSVRRKMT